MNTIVLFPNQSGLQALRQEARIFAGAGGGAAAVGSAWGERPGAALGGFLFDVGLGGSVRDSAVVAFIITVIDNRKLICLVRCIFPELKERRALLSHVTSMGCLLFPA